MFPRRFLIREFTSAIAEDSEAASDDWEVETPPTGCDVLGSGETVMVARDGTAAAITFLPGKARFAPGSPVVAPLRSPCAPSPTAARAPTAETIGARDVPDYNQPNITLYTKQILPQARISD